MLEWAFLLKCGHTGVVVKIRLLEWREIFLYYNLCGTQTFEFSEALNSLGNTTNLC